MDNHTRDEKGRQVPRKTTPMPPQSLFPEKSTPAADTLPATPPDDPVTTAGDRSLAQVWAETASFLDSMLRNLKPEAKRDFGFKIRNYGAAVQCQIPPRR